MKPYIVLVTGGRRFTDATAVEEALGSFLGRQGLMVLQGGSSGADSLAREWCKTNDVPCLTLTAHWDRGPSAGPVRNARMLWLSPDIVLAFPGGTGTDSMLKLAGEAGVPVRLASA